MTPESPPDSKLTRTKQRWAAEGRFLTGKVARSEEQRLPPGQHLTKDCARALAARRLRLR